MNEVSLLQSLGQVSASETGQVFREFLRGHVREMICEVMAAEVTESKNGEEQRGTAESTSANGVWHLLDNRTEEMTGNLISFLDV